MHRKSGWTGAAFAVLLVMAAPALAGTAEATRAAGPAQPAADVVLPALADEGPVSPYAVAARQHTNAATSATPQSQLMLRRPHLPGRGTTPAGARLW